MVWCFFDLLAKLRNAFLHFICCSYRVWKWFVSFFEKSLSSSWQSFCIFGSPSSARWSTKSRIDSLALSDMIFLIFLLLTKLVSLIKFSKFSSFTSRTLPSSSLWACLKRQTLLFCTKNSMNFLSYSLNKYPSSFLSLDILSSYSE